MVQPPPNVTIIGAGIGGLAAALRLSHAGLRVTVLERAATPGGKMRTLPTPAGPVDAGPTVLTMKPVFDDLFAAVGVRLQDHVTLEPEHVLARHFWPDGAQLDLTADRQESGENIAAVFGAKSALEFETFAIKMQKLFDAFDKPMMQTAVPTQAALIGHVMKNPSLILAMQPHLNMAQSVHRHFSDPRLAQLFARYATYVGSVPNKAPSILGLIAHSEAQGVWRVKGGMHKLAVAIEKLAVKFGAEFRYNTHAERIETQNDCVCAVQTRDGRIPTDAVLFNGDPRALAQGHLGQTPITAVPNDATEPRSLSANVLSFAARAHGLPLSAHNVLFADDPRAEYAPLIKGQTQTDPTFYICAEDRFGGSNPSDLERFEIIMNAPAVPDGTTHSTKERQQCQTQILDRLRSFGLTFTPQPTDQTLTMPADFAQMFPASNGSLYGRSPHGMMAAFKRPTARTALKGLYLVGGGVHPGAGVPMATLCARHAAGAIMQDLTLTSTSRQADMRGGMSTV